MRASLTVAVLLGLGVSGLMCARVADRGRYATAYSTYSAGPEGTRAVHDLLQRRGHPTQRWVEDLEGLPERSTLAQLALALAYLRAHLRDVPDFPKPGILFKDITPLLADPRALHITFDLLAQRFIGERIDVVVGVESRGFIFGGALSARLNASFVPVRKPGKLPWKKDRVAYSLEYGEAELETIRQAHYAASDELHGAQGLLAEAALEVSRLEERIRYVVEGRNRAQQRLAELQAQNSQWAERQEAAKAEDFAGGRRWTIAALLQSPQVAASQLFEREHGLGELLPYVAQLFPGVPVLPVAVRIGATRAQWDHLVARLSPWVTPRTLVR